MPKIICKHQRCNTLVEKGANNGYCEAHKEHGEKLIKEANNYRMKIYNSTRRDKTSSNFYNDPAWKHLQYGARTQALRRDKYLCQHCLEQGHLNSINLEVHHIVPLKEAPELGLVLENLLTLCRSCHKKEDDKLKKYKCK